MELTELKFLTQEQLLELIKIATSLLDEENRQQVNVGWWDASK
jgi:hypothetical protein